MTIPHYDMPRIELDAKVIANYKLQSEAMLKVYATKDAEKPYEVEAFTCAERIYVENALTGKMLALLYPQNVSPDAIKYLGNAGDWLLVYLLTNDQVTNVMTVQS